MDKKPEPNLKPPSKAAPLKKKILHTLKFLVPGFLGVSLAHATRGLETLWESFPSLLMINAVLFVIGILGWHLADRLQNKK